MKFLARLFFLLVLAAAGAGAWAWYSIETPYQKFPSEGVFVDLPHGASSRTVARLLQENGVVRSSVAFEIYARRHPRRRLQAGEYFFDHAMSGHDVFWKIANGQIYEQPFTVREGETMFEIAQDLDAGKFVAQSEFLDAARNPELIRDVAPRAPTLEGFLYPATYFLPRHPKGAELTAEMVHKFKEEWQRIAAPGAAAGAAETQTRPVAAIVTLASLVERETPKPEERPLVAGAFENRLRKGMLLQCDPTVIYVLEQNGKYRGTLTTADLHIDSPYNTYVHTGLPPGPIGNPGEASLRAALAPAKTDFIYFVANTQGGHFFSATLAEHNRNVTRYRRMLAGLPADPPLAPPAPPKKPATKRHRGTAR
ncbi:MAG TPA: endolytic transglycosylase MltG [Candidatus Acidoferrum sp.]